jgi:hypothetical protein
VAATAGEDGTARLWDVTDGSQRRALEHPRAVLCVAFSPDGRLLATGCTDQRVRVWDVATGDLVHVLTGHQAAVNALAFRPQSSVLASAGEDQGLLFWDAERGANLSSHASDRPAGEAASREREAPPKPTAARQESHLVFSPDGRRLAFGNTRGATQLWDADSRRLVLALDDTESEGNHHVAFTPDGGQIITTQRYEVRVWDSQPQPPQSRIARAVQQLVGWHRQRANVAWKARDWFGVEFHADRVCRAEPENAEWLARRGLGRMLQGRTAEADADREARVGIGKAIAIEEQVRAYGGPQLQLTQEVLTKLASAIENARIPIVPTTYVDMGGSGNGSGDGHGGNGSGGGGANAFNLLMTLLATERLTGAPLADAVDGEHAAESAAMREAIRSRIVATPPTA